MGELGLTQGLIDIAHEIPDARDRLSHVGQRPSRRPPVCWT
jgi:chemotaxis regulatin CheY-phosphate phosphatase CheZ